jgi:hypothetical protein
LPESQKAKHVAQVMLSLEVEAEMRARPVLPSEMAGAAATAHPDGRAVAAAMAAERDAAAEAEAETEAASEAEADTEEAREADAYADAADAEATSDAW